ncbi:MAG: hypothetical protein RQ885_03590 [Desulfurococcales archaeon]|jgi:hypothetical protein|nr:hypothetical protein [Desulfurococcales archaeon]
MGILICDVDASGGELTNCSGAVSFFMVVVKLISIQFIIVLMMR